MSNIHLKGFIEINDNILIIITRLDDEILTIKKIYVSKRLFRINLNKLLQFYPSITIEYTLKLIIVVVDRWTQTIK